MAEEAAKLPEWLELLKVAAYVISAAGFVLNYSLRKKSQRRLAVNVKVFYRRLRGAPIRVLQWCSTSVHTLFSKIYGNSWARRIAIAMALSIAYFLLMVWQARPPADSLSALRREKAEFERQADERLFRLPPQVREEAAETVPIPGPGDSVDFEPKYKGEVYDKVRQQLADFPEKFQALIDQSPRHSQIAWLAFSEGTYLDPGFKFGPFFTLVLWNIIIDVSAWAFTIFAIRRWMAGGENALQFSIGLMAILAVVALSFLLSLFAYTQFLHGVHEVFLILFGIPFFVAILVGGIAVVYFGYTTKESAGVFIGAYGAIFALAAGWAVWKLTGLRQWADIPSFTMNRSYDRLPYLIAASTILPLAVALAVMIGSLFAKLFATATKSLLLQYLRIIFRLDKPVLLVLTATPGAVAFFLTQVYPVAHKYF